MNRISGRISQLSPKSSEELGICIAAEFLTMFLNNPEEARNLLDSSSPPSAVDERFRYFRVRGITARKCGSYDEARTALEEAIELRGPSSSVLRLLADVAYRRNDFLIAERLIDKAIAFAEGPQERGHAIANKALIFQDTEREEEAIEFYKKAERLLAEAGDIYAVSDALNNRGVLHLDEDQIDEAEKAFRQALEIRTLIDHRQGQCYCNMGLSIAHRFRYCIGQGEEHALEAHRFLDQALQALPRAGGQPDRALVLKNQGDLFLDQWLLGYAEHSLGQALNLFESLGDQSGPVFSCLLSLLELHILRQDERMINFIHERLESLVPQGQLPDKLYWYGQLTRGISNRFKLDLDSLPVPIYRHRVAQFWKVLGKVNKSEQTGTPDGDPLALGCQR